MEDFRLEIGDRLNRMAINQRSFTFYWRWLTENLVANETCCDAPSYRVGEAQRAAQGSLASPKIYTSETYQICLVST
jgi:hypothetical protein